VHKGELGAACETCHSARSFEVGTFVHARQQRPFFAGQHAALRCVQCHAPQASRMGHVGLARTSDTCASCHADVHAGQLGAACETCHTVDRAKFVVPSFAHEKTKFPLTGKHAPLACATCHKVETAAFPAGTVTARRFRGVGVDCASCHQDRHGGQLTQGCQTCHATDTFAVTRYKHLRVRALGDFFTGRHLSPPCSGCHKPVKGTAAVALVNYRTPTTCVSCHTDVHRGGLGPRCETCHKP
jgi:predicted CXXCH cytochrome family protein